jgi:hypothetical protein
MTNEEAKKMLKAKLECFKNEISGINHDCNMRLCDGCSLNYEQGNMGEQKEALDMAIKALEQQPCEDCISREDAKNLFWDGTEGYDCRGFTRMEIGEMLDDLPSVKPQPKIGHWEDCSNGWMCSNCYKDVSHESDFCPHCGADMKSEDKG